jgi:hypothetical protein
MRAARLTEMAAPFIKHGTKLAVLFGAGASYGYTLTPDQNPPLGASLFPALKQQCRTWQNKEIVSLFERETSFEAPMATLCDPSSPHPLLDRLTHELCEYLASFRPTKGPRNFYARVVDLVFGSGRITETLFCTLNYDCIFDETLSRYMEMHRQQHAFKILKQVLNHHECDFPLKMPSLLKLHGSVNYFPLGDMMGATSINSGQRFEDEGPHDVEGAIHAERIGDPLQSYYREASAKNSWRWPLIAHYAPRKPPHLHPRLRDLPKFWRKWVTDCKAVIIIGVNTLPDDPHIWDVFDDWEGHVYFAGSQGDRLQEKLGDRYHHIGDKFQEAVDNHLEGVLTGARWSSVCTDALTTLKLGNCHLVVRLASISPVNDIAITRAGRPPTPPIRPRHSSTGAANPGATERLARARAP